MNDLPLRPTSPAAVVTIQRLRDEPTLFGRQRFRATDVTLSHAPGEPARVSWRASDSDWTRAVQRPEDQAQVQTSMNAILEAGGELRRSNYRATDLRRGFTYITTDGDGRGARYYEVPDSQLPKELSQAIEGIDGLTQGIHEQAVPTAAAEAPHDLRPTTRDRALEAENNRNA